MLVIHGLSKIKKKQRSLSSLIRWIIFIFLPVIIVGLFVIMFIFQQSRIQTAQDLKKTLDYQSLQFDNTIFRINNYVLDSLLYNENARQINENSDPLMMIFYSNRFIEDLTRIQGVVGYDFNFFYYNPDKGISISTPRTTLDYNEMNQVRTVLINTIDENNRLAGTCFYSWDILKVGRAWYIYKYYRNQGQVLGCWSRGDRALAFIDSVINEKNSFYTVLDKNGVPVVAADQLKESRISLNNGNDCYYDGGYLVYRYNSKTADFSYAVVSSDRQGLKGMVFVQITLFILMAGLIFLCTILLLFLKRDIVEPIRYFSKNISEYSEEKRLKKGKSFIELEQAIDKFDDLAKQVRNLKIDIYEEKINRQKTELEYLKSQIKPHFFINCLNMIYAMIQTGRYTAIQELVLLISKYMRYQFRNSFDKVSITDELNHVREYTKILGIQYSGKFALESEIEDDAASCLIPPLIIMTMVENSIKHNITSEDIIKIRVQIKKITENDCRKIKISIADTGSGMEPGILALLNNGNEITKSGHDKHIGIANTVRRLSIIYGENAKIRFSNVPGGGCLVEIIVPAWQEENADLNDGAR